MDQVPESESSDSFHLFLSGTNFLLDEKATLYQGPRHSAGKAEIDFGGSVEDVKTRVAKINSLYRAGNEFGSHTVGHFNGGVEKENWSESEWAREFKSYNFLLDNVGKNNNLRGVKFDFTATDIKGFRAPYLSTSLELDPALNQFHFVYDTSRTSGPSEWPIKVNSIWRFKLASIPVEGYPDPGILSMDFNFYHSQADEHDDPPNYVRFRKEMLDAYINYFKSNYEGNRAPIHIGHHFYDYEGGIYKEALMAFARAVCTITEVKCVTYSELAGFLEKQDQATLEAYQRGDFEKIKLSALDLGSSFSDSPPLIAVEVKDRRHVQAVLIGDDQIKYKSGKFEWSLGTSKKHVGSTFAVSNLTTGRKTPVTVSFRDSKGNVLWRDTFSLSITDGSVALVEPRPELIFPQGPGK
jgi:hypothetical protein